MLRLRVWKVHAARTECTRPVSLSSTRRPSLRKQRTRGFWLHGHSSTSMHFPYSSRDHWSSEPLRCTTRTPRKHFDISQKLLLVLLTLFEATKLCDSIIPLAALCWAPSASWKMGVRLGAWKFNDLIKAPPLDPSLLRRQTNARYNAPPCGVRA